MKNEKQDNFLTLSLLGIYAIGPAQAAAAQALAGVGSGEGENAKKARERGLWLALAAETDESWQKLAAYMAATSISSGFDFRSDRFATAARRKALEPELDAAIAQWCLDISLATETETGVVFSTPTHMQ